MCQTVLFHHDSIGSARIFQYCRTTKHRLLNVFQHLWTNRNLQLLNDFVTHTTCHEKHNQHPFDKEQTLFLAQLCLTVFRLDPVRKEQCTSVCPCSNRESRGPRRRLDGCRGIHHIRSPNCLPTFRSYVVFPSRPTENRRCMLAAHGTSHVNRSWSAGTSTPETDSTASMIDLTCPLTSFAELSAAPLDCGSP